MVRAEKTTTRSCLDRHLETESKDRKVGNENIDTGAPRRRRIAQEYCQYRQGETHYFAVYETAAPYAAWSPVAAWQTVVAAHLR